MDAGFVKLLADTGARRAIAQHAQVVVLSDEEIRRADQGHNSPLPDGERVVQALHGQLVVVQIKNRRVLVSLL
ncbi:MAG: hypothetical protein AAB676_13060 [Verrucomicrobiota bacterium]